MKLAIIIDSTCDLTAAELEQLEVERVPLYVTFQGETKRDWLEITPADIIAGVSAGADLPTTSQPSPQDFAEVFERVAAAGAEQILVITLTAELSGTYQSAVIAAEASKTPVTVFDSRAASLGHGEMARVASAMRDRGAGLDEILLALERIRDTNFLLFTVGSMEYLQKGGRIGKASALLGSLLNIKPILTLVDGKIEPLSRARGMKKAQQEMVDRLKAYVDAAGVPVIANLIHIQDIEAAEGLRRALDAAGVSYTLNGIHEMGAVVGSHVGPNTFGMYAHHAVE